MPDLLEIIIDKLLQAPVRERSVIPWSLPVPGFGRVEQARCATLGINPSNLEFTDHDGRELSGPQRRLHTLHSLGRNSWADVTKDDIKTIATYCRAYFERNPYDGWFRPLDELLIALDASFYPSLITKDAACHLDLVPFATEPKWGLLPRSVQQRLLELGVDTLGQMLGNMDLDILILNGMAVVHQLQHATSVRLEPVPMPGWDLPRKNGATVRGMAFRGTITRFLAIKLRKPVLVLGYNHNLQSTYGMTRYVRDAIRDWIRQQSRGVEA